MKPGSKFIWSLLWIILSFFLLFLTFSSFMASLEAKYSLLKLLSICLGLIVFTILIAETNLKSSFVLIVIALGFFAINLTFAVEPVNFWNLLAPETSFAGSSGWLLSRTLLAWAIFCSIYYDRLLEGKYFKNPQTLWAYILTFLALPVLILYLAGPNGFNYAPLSIIRPLEIVPMVIEFVFVLLLVSICFEAFSSYRQSQFYKGYLEKQNFIINHLGRGILALDNKNKVITFNKYLTDKIGIEPSEILDKDIRTILGGTLKELENLEYHPASHSWNGEIALQSPTHGPIEFSIMATQIAAPSGENNGTVAILRDVVEIRHQEMEQISLLLLTETILSGIIVIDHHEKIFSINQTAEKLMNCTLRAKQKKSLTDACENESFIPIVNYLREALYEGKPCTLKDLEIGSGENKKILAFESYPLRSSAGEILGAACLFRDITQERFYERYIEKAEQMSALGQISAGVAHEIRNPLTSVRGFLQLIKTKSQNQEKFEEFEEYADIALTEIDRANDIITDFLKFAKPQKPKLLQDDLNRIIAEVIKIITPGFYFKNIEIIFNKQDLPPVTLDRDQWKQVFLNLFQNSMQAMSSEGKLSISTCLDPNEGKAVVNISDTGCGMTEETLNKIFTPFFTTKENGSGLGLSIVYRIIKDHGGAIAVDSVNDQGTTFTISIPLKREETLFKGSPLS